MKKLVKALTLMLVIAVLCAAFVACGSNESDIPALEGTSWVIDTVTTEDGEFSGDDVSTIFGGEVIYTFDADGVSYCEVGDYSTEGTYEEGDGTVTITMSEVTTEMKYDGKTISFENETGSCVMVKK